MKKERWYYLKNEWEQAQQEDEAHAMEWREELEEKEEKGLLVKAFERVAWWKGKDEGEHKVEYAPSQEQLRMKTMTLAELKHSFLEDLYLSQLRWASSSLLEESTLHPRYKRDEWLRFLTQQLPDNYFLMYKPVFHIKQAPIDLDVILISPAEIILITLIEGHEHSVFEASADRFWTEYVNKTRRKRLSPLLSMTRMSGVVEWMLEQQQFSFPIRRIVLSPNSLIDNKVNGVNVQFVDKRIFNTWHEQMKRQPSPLKHDQMKVTSLLFRYCTSASSQQEQEGGMKQEE